MVQRRFQSFFAVALLLSALLSGAPAQEKLKASDVFLQAFMLLREARQLETAKNYAKAAAKCREASEMYDSITRRWPAWEISMVDGRRKKVRKDYLRLDNLAREASAQTAQDPSLPQRSSSPIGMAPKTTRPSSIATTPRAATPRQRFQMLEREVERLRSDRSRLLRQSQDQQDNTMAANRALGEERERVHQLTKQLAEAQNELDRLEGAGVVALKNQVAELKEQLAQATESLTEQNARTEKILAEYEQSDQKIQELSLQVEEITTQRDEMAAIIKGLQTGESSLQLVVENTRLREQLNATQARVDELEFDKLENEAEIAELRKEVSLLRLELAQVKQENETYKQRLIKLQGTLDDTEQELTFNPPSIENQAARQENEILRDIIGRQLKQQTFRQQKRELIIAELQNLEAGSDDLIAKINAMAEEVTLSEEEQAAMKAKAPATAAANSAGVSSTVPEVGREDVDRKIVRYAEAAAFNFEQGRYESAETYYSDILAFAPQHVDTLCNLGVTQIRLNKVSEARKVFEKAILSNAESGRANLLHGVACFHLDESDTAIASVRKAMELEPRNAEPPSFLGAVYLLRGNWADAIPTLQSAVDIQPRHAHAHFNLSLALLSQQPSPDVRLAHAHYEEALKHGIAKSSRMEAIFRKWRTPGTGTTSAIPAPAPETPAS